MVIRFLLATYAQEGVSTPMEMGDLGRESLVASFVIL